MSTAKKTSKSFVRADVVEDTQPRTMDELLHINLLKHLKGEKKIGEDQCVCLTINSGEQQDSERAQHLIAALVNLGGKIAPSINDECMVYAMKVAKAIEERASLCVEVFDDSDRVATVIFEKGFKISAEKLENFPSWNDKLQGRKRFNDIAIKEEGDAAARFKWTGTYVLANLTSPWKSFVASGHRHCDFLKVD